MKILIACEYSGVVRDTFAKKGHPKGALGMKHSQKTKAIISVKSKEMWKKTTPAQKKIRGERFVESLKKSGNWKRPGGYSRTRSGKRADLDNQFFRSGTEANFARYLRFIGVEYEYETKEFIFHDIRRGVIAYTPDFYIPETTIYYEIKGWLDKKSITRLRRFRMRYPCEFSRTRIVKQKLTDKDYNVLLNKIGFCINQIINFKSIEKYKSMIPKWE